MFIYMYVQGREVDICIEHVLSNTYIPTNYMYMYLLYNNSLIYDCIIDWLSFTAQGIHRLGYMTFVQLSKNLHLRFWTHGTSRYHHWHSSLYSMHICIYTVYIHVNYVGLLLWQGSLLTLTCTCLDRALYRIYSVPS